MDDMFALEGGSAAARWQRRHRKRKALEAKRRFRAQIRAEAKADLKKRRKKWRAANEARKAAGEPVNRRGKPRDMRKPQYLDMTGQRFGRLTVLRVAPISRNGKNHGRHWWVKCDCGSGEKRVGGTNLRQGILNSCGCLRSEGIRENWKTGKLAKMYLARQIELTRPISYRLRALRKRLLSGLPARGVDLKLLGEARKCVVRDEVARGVIKVRKRSKLVAAHTTAIN